MKRACGLALLVLWALAAPAAQAANVVLSLSKPRVTITSSFSGDSIVLFGVVEPADGESETPYDIIATVRGPNEGFITWRKERRLGLWTNVDSRTFLAAPSYLAVLSNRPPDSIAELDTLRQEQAGFAHNRLLQRVGSDYADVVADDPFRQAFLRVKQAQGLYFERTAAVEFIAPRVFRATIPVPGTAPVGTYDVVVKTFQAGQVVNRSTATLDVAKIDFEQVVAVAAQEHAWLYGLATALGALGVGFLASIVFRRD